MGEFGRRKLWLVVFVALIAIPSLVDGVEFGYNETKLTASDAAVGDRFGASVAISGDYVIVGASRDDGPAAANQGSAYVYARSGTTWTQQAHLIAHDAATGDYFGTSVAINGDYAIVGAYQDDGPAGTDQGSAYVFVRSGTTWTQQAHLFASNAVMDDQFGYSVAISGSYAIVGAPFDNGPDGPAGLDQGSAYVFVRSGPTWTQQAHLVASDGAGGDQFGHSVAINGDYAIVGAITDDGPAGIEQGSAYIFVRSGTTWTQQAHLFASDAAAGDIFGTSVAINGDYAIVGAYQDDGPAGSRQGSAYVFVRSGTTWTQQAHLFASDAASDDRFGRSVAISGDYAIVGADFDDGPAGSGQGSAYVFVRSGTTWTQQAHLFASDAGTGEMFGASVAISGDYAIVGAQGDDGPAGGDQGSAYVFVPECPEPESTSPCTLPVSEYVGSGASFLNPGLMVRTLSVPDFGLITDLELSIDVAPLPRFKNITVSLAHGSSVTLMQAGSTSDTSNLSGIYTFDDEAATTLNSAAIGAAGNVPPGVYRGVSALSAFDGVPMLGGWLLQIEDFVFVPPADPQAAHILNSWTLTITSEIDDHDVCTCTRCVNGVCRQAASEFGNVNCAGAATPNLDDILCVLAGFANFDACPGADVSPPCTGNNLINLDDILDVLAAFSGDDPCGC